MRFVEPAPEIMKMIQGTCDHNSCGTCRIRYICRTFCITRDISPFEKTIRKIYYESYCENPAENVSVSEKEIMSLFGAAYE